MDNNKYNRRSIRLKIYDYSQPGAYFITIVTHNRQCLFGEIVNGEMRLYEYGEIVRDEWFCSWGDRPVAPTDDRMVAPTTTIGTTTRTVKKIIVIVCRRVQINRYQTNKSNSSNPWHSCLATQLLRTHHP